MNFWFERGSIFHDTSLAFEIFLWVILFMSLLSQHLCLISTSAGMTKLMYQSTEKLLEMASLSQIWQLFRTAHFVKNKLKWAF